MKQLLIAAFALAVLSLAPTFAFAQTTAPAHVVVGGHSSKVIVPWIVIGCAGGIILAAFHANYRDGRELTQPEAWTCGLLFWLSYPTQQKVIRRARVG